MDKFLVLVRALVWAKLSLPFLKLLGLAWVCFGLATFMYESSTDPRGATRRLAVAYVTYLDDQFRRMFMPARGAYMAWLQLYGALALVATYGFVRNLGLVYAAIAAVVLPPVYVIRRVRIRGRRLNDQVHGFALALANALKTTASIGDALGATVAVTAKPLREELETALKQMKVGSTLEDALLAMAGRAQSTALDVVVSALLIGRQTGGELPRILEGPAGSLRELNRLEELTERVVSSAKQAVAVAAAIVVLLAAFLPRVMPGFFDPLRDTIKGQIVALQCAIVFCLALYLGYRFTRTDI